jgi:hypothetical protein
MVPQNYNVHEPGPTAPYIGPSITPSIEAHIRSLPSPPIKFPVQPPSNSNFNLQPTQEIAHTQNPTHTTLFTTQAKYIPSDFSSSYQSFSNPSQHGGELGSKNHENGQYDGYNGYNGEVQPLTYNSYSGAKTFDTNAAKEELNDGFAAFYINPLTNVRSSEKAIKMFDMHSAFKDAMNIDSFYDMSTLELPKGFGGYY